MKTLALKSLTKWYGPTRGVEDLTFDIAPGEIFGYLGPNGSGKTTTLRCLMGLIRPTRGEAHVLGKRVRPGRATQHSRIGYLPGEFRIWSRLTAGRALRVLASFGNNGEATEKRRNELAERLELDMDQRMGRLSRGNRQKVGVIYAFQHKPDVLILDEPTTGLDPLMRQVVLDLIREAAGEGATVLLSSHELSEVAAVCGRAGILREGRLVELAPISEIVRKGERRLKVWFVNDSEPPALPADRLPDVRVVESGPGMLDLAYRGQADPILKWLAQYSVDRISTPETSLEEAFMRYYRRDNPEDGKGGDS